MPGIETLHLLAITLPLMLRISIVVVLITAAFIAYQRFHPLNRQAQRFKTTQQLNRQR